jgi:acyl-CoA synthetase (AMP-forming)/AMP-acid ligase II
MAETCVYLTSCYVGNTLQVLDGTVCCGDSSVHEPSGTFIVIADEESGRILIDGSVGEICVRSPSLASEYWNKPELTQCLASRLTTAINISSQVT